MPSILLVLFLYQSSKKSMNYIWNHENTESQRGDINIDNVTYVVLISKRLNICLYLSCALPTAILASGILPRLNLLNNKWHVTTLFPRLRCDSLIPALLPAESQGQPNHQSLLHFRSPLSRVYLMYWLSVPDIHFLFVWNAVHISRLLS